MRQRALSLVIVLLSLATLIGFTSAVRSEDLVAVGATDLGSLDGGGLGASSGATAGTGAANVPAATGGADIAGRPTSPGGSDVVGGQVPGDAGGPGPAVSGGEGAAGPPVRIAYLVPDLAGVGAVFGGSGFQGEDDAERIDREFRALIDEVNATGGVNGRPVEARGFTFSIAEQADEASLVRRCIEITEDYGASYVIDTHIMLYPTVQQCFAQHQVVLVSLGANLNDQLMAELAPYSVTTHPTTDRQFRNLVPALAEVGYFDGATVGVFLDDSPYVERPYREILQPALGGAGIEIAAEARARPNDASALSNAVLRFRSAGVTHVVFIGGIVHFAGFSSAAEAQGYRPRYAFSDYQSIPGAAAQLGSPAQMAEAVAVSACTSATCISDDASRSSADTQTPYDPARLSPGRRRCFDALSAARGVDYYRPAESQPSYTVDTVCDYFHLWLDVLRASGTDFSPARFASSLQAMGSTYQSAQIYATDFSDSRRSGATHFAAGVFEPACTCYVRRTEWTAAG